MAETLKATDRKYDEIFACLAAPFSANEVRYRNQGGVQVPYVTARTVMNRLDEVLGPANWWDSYQSTPNGAICRLTVRLDGSTTITKEDAGGAAGMQDDGDDEKSGFSDALKRVAVKFGVGRYLYRNDIPNFVKAVLGISDLGEFEPRSFGGGGNGGGGYQSPPRRDDPQPSRNGGDRPASNGGGYQGGNGGGNLPRSNRALYPWVKGLDEQHSGLKAVDRLNAHAKGRGWPYKMTEYSEDQVKEAVGLVQKALADYQGTPSAPSAPPQAAANRPIDRDYAPSNAQSEDEDRIPF